MAVRFSIKVHFAGQVMPKTRLQSDRTRFPWAEIDEQTTALLLEAELKLRREIRAQSHSILVSGGILRKVKEILPHGQFKLYVTAVLGYSMRSAQNYMAAHKAFAESKSATISPLRPSAIYRLASRSILPSEREEILQALEEPYPDIPAIEKRILKREMKESSGEEATGVLAILQQISNLLRSHLTEKAYGEFCLLITDQLILAVAKSLSAHLEDVFASANPPGHPLLATSEAHRTS